MYLLERDGGKEEEWKVVGENDEEIEREIEKKNEQSRRSDPVTGDSPSVLWLTLLWQGGFFFFCVCVCESVCVAAPVPIIHCLSAAGSQTEDNSSSFCLVKLLTFLLH